MKKYGIGVIGLGMGSTVLEINGIKSSQLEVRGVCAAHYDKAQYFKEKYNLKYAAKEYHELIEKNDIDIIAIYSPDHLHAEHAIAALKAEKHIICTKPMVTDLEDAKVIANLVREKNVKFLTGQTMRYDPEFATIKKMYDDGDLGSAIAAEAHYVHDLRSLYPLTPWRLDVPQDLMYGGVSHPVDVLRWFFGDVDEVFAYGVKGKLEKRYPYENNFIVSLKFKNGTIARILGLYDIVEPPMPMMGVSIFGSKGTAIGDFTDRRGGKVKVVYDKFEYKTTSQMDYPAEIEGAYGHGTTVLRYLRHFEECLETNRDPVPDAVEGAKSIAVCSAAWDSIKSGKPVKVFNEF